MLTANMGSVFSNKSLETSIGIIPENPVMIDWTWILNVWESKN